jgi:hypothetical protein
MSTKTKNTKEEEKDQEHETKQPAEKPKQPDLPKRDVKPAPGDRPHPWPEGPEPPK